MARCCSSSVSASCAAPRTMPAWSARRRQNWRSSAVKTLRPGVEELDQAAGVRAHDERREQVGLEAHLDEEGVLGGVAAVADRRRRLDELGHDALRRRVVVERIVLGRDVELGRRDDVRRPVGHHLRLRVERRDEAGRCVEEERQLAGEDGHCLAGISRGPQRASGLDHGDQVRKTAISRNSPGTHGYPRYRPRRPKLDEKRASKRSARAPMGAAAAPACRRRRRRRRVARLGGHRDGRRRGCRLADRLEITGFGEVGSPLLEPRLALHEDRQDRRGDEDRRIGAGRDADDEGEREVLERPRSEGEEQHHRESA